MSGRYEPLPEDSRPWRVRTENERLAASAQRHRFDDYAPVPFLCECDDESCGAFVTLTLPEYREWSERFLITAPGHDVRPVRRAVRTRAFELYLVPDAAPGPSGRTARTSLSAAE